LLSQSKDLLKPLKNIAIGPRPGVGFRSSRADSAGLSVNALMTEKTTATAMVSANCL
jgi:hypothetical protein